MSDGKTVVKFGTDGWRGIIADDFTYENVRVAAAAIANYVLEHEDAKAGVCIGWDTRFGSRSFAKVVAEVLAKADTGIAQLPQPAAQYLLPFAARSRFLFKMDFAEAQYISELRSGPAGHFSYRRVAWEMYLALQRQHPSLARHIRATDFTQPIDLLQR